MKNIMKKKLAAFLGLTAFCLILWPLADMAIAHFFTHQAFTYSLVKHVACPMIFSSVFSLIDLAFTNRRTNA